MTRLAGLELEGALMLEPHRTVPHLNGDVFLEDHPLVPVVHRRHNDVVTAGTSLVRMRWR
jgi:hypothetical protein